MKPLFVVSGIINAIMLVALVLFLGIQLPSFGMWYYRWQFSINDTYVRVNMEPEHLHEVTAHMIDYLQIRIGRDELQINTIVGGYERPFFSDIEIRHMYDVYDLFEMGIMLRNIAAVVFILTLLPFVFLRNKLKKSTDYLLNGWKWMSLGIFSALFALVVAIAINWHRAFVIFHEIFFDNDYWILNPNVDLLLNIVPYDFFINLSIFIGAFFAAGLAIIFAISAILLKRRRRRPSISFGKL